MFDCFVKLVTCLAVSVFTIVVNVNSLVIGDLFLVTGAKNGFHYCAIALTQTPDECPFTIRYAFFLSLCLSVCVCCCLSVSFFVKQYHSR
jgi:hypothetical protein